VMAARRNRPLVLVDIAVPRNIATDVQEINNVYLYDVDDLEIIARENVKHREQELSRCTAINDERTDAVLAKIAPSREEYYEPKIPSHLGWAFSAAAA
jgi:glutamyl-tRNA reductase